MDITSFKEIPQYTEGGSWECNFDIDGVWDWINRESVELGLDMNPDFQRAHVWTERQQRYFIEYFLRGGKTGRVLYFNHEGWGGTYEGEFVIVDGKQRCEAVRKFIANELKAFGHYFRELGNPRMIHNSFRINVNNLKTRAAVLNWYLEMNTGGTPHSQAEIGKVLSMLKQEAVK